MTAMLVMWCPSTDTHEGKTKSSTNRKMSALSIQTIAYRQHSLLPRSPFELDRADHHNAVRKRLTPDPAGQPSSDKV